MILSLQSDSGLLMLVTSHTSSLQGTGVHLRL